MFTRIGLFLLTNLAVLVLAGIVMSVLRVNPAQMSGLLVMAAIFGAIFSLVVLLVVHYVMGGRWLKGVDRGRALPSTRALRWFNELPLVLFIAIVYLVLAKPF